MELTAFLTYLLLQLLRFQGKILIHFQMRVAIICAWDLQLTVIAAKRTSPE